MLTIIICAILFVMMFILFIYVYRKWKGVQIDMLTERQLLGQNDLIVMVSIAIEFLQYCAIGPDFNSISDVISEMGKGAAVDMDEFVNLTDGVFWVVLYFVMALSSIWVGTSIIVILKIDLKYDTKFCRNFAFFAELILPIIGNPCFLPIVSILLDVFICTEGTGDDY
jgi:hypothetical protein